MPRWHDDIGHVGAGPVKEGWRSGHWMKDRTSQRCAPPKGRFAVLDPTSCGPTGGGMGQSIRIPRRRWGIGLLLGAGVLVNYFDRVNLSVAGPQLSAEFHLNPTELGLLFSGYAWTYAVLQIPAGVVLDRLGVTLVGRVGAFLWAVASALTAVAGGFTGNLRGPAAARRRGGADLPRQPPRRRVTGSPAASGRWPPPSSTLRPNSPTHRVADRGPGRHTTRLALGIHHHGRPQPDLLHRLLAAVSRPECGQNI